MPSAMSLHFESDHPFIAVPLEGETIQDLQIQIAKIVENPYDMMAFDAGYFNGAINLSQLWNALLYIAREGPIRRSSSLVTRASSRKCTRPTATMDPSCALPSARPSSTRQD